MDQNSFIALAVDSANRILEELIRGGKEPWLETLVSTRTREDPNAIMLPVPIDSVREIARSEDFDDTISFVVMMHEPSINSFRYESAAYVSSIRVKMPKPRFNDMIIRIEFTVEVTEDRFEIGEGRVQDMEWQNPGIPRNWDRVVVADTEQERVALEALREMVTEKEYRNYIKRGFLVVRGSSGREYQLFRTKWHAKVRERGKIVAEICSRISDHKVPLTDSVIAFKIMIETDESEFEKAGNVYRLAS